MLCSVFSVAASAARTLLSAASAASRSREDYWRLERECVSDEHSLVVAALNHHCFHVRGKREGLAHEDQRRGDHAHVEPIEDAAQSNNERHLQDEAAAYVRLRVGCRAGQCRLPVG